MASLLFDWKRDKDNMIKIILLFFAYEKIRLTHNLIKSTYNIIDYTLMQPI